MNAAMTRSPPCILLYNPISGHGHLDSWNAFFAGFLLQGGYRVLALTPDRSVLQQALDRVGLTAHPRLCVLDWNEGYYGLKAYTERLRKAWRQWMIYAEDYANKGQATRPVSTMPVRTRVKKRCLQVIIPSLYHLGRCLHAALCRNRAAPGPHKRAKEFEEINLLDPAEIGFRIARAVKAAPWRPDVLFNMYMDLYKIGAQPWNEFAAACRLPWAGIRFVPSDTAQESYYALPSLRGMCFLDESFCQQYRRLLPEKYFEHLPDITNVDLPDNSFPLAETVLERAAGRRIVFLGGSIGGHKNIGQWCRLISLADPKCWFFIQIGEMHKNTLSADDIAAYKQLTADAPGNVLLYERYMADEREFNALINLSDVIFAVYRDFRISSNMLVKAAVFEKPILVSDRHLMGERVRRYGIGLGVPEENPRAMLYGLEKLILNPMPSKNFAAFRSDSSAKVMADRLEGFFDRILGAKSFSATT